MKRMFKLSQFIRSSPRSIAFFL